MRITDLRFSREYVYSVVELANVHLLAPLQDAAFKDEQTLHA